MKLKLNIFNSSKITINGVPTTSINLENVTNSTIKNCIFDENGKVQGEAVFDLLCENNIRLSSTEPHVEVNNNSVDVDNNSVDVDNNSVDVDNNSVDVDNNR
ncbi:Uncharacterised protein [Klebsiella pneumoniae]|nr:Uncharacterised protein [Klebsiella pneumoniae]